MQRLTLAMTNGILQHWRSNRISDNTEAQRAARMSGADRRERLIEAAEEAFSREGLQGTTTAALARRAGVTEPVLYIHFESKEQLFREVVRRSMERRLRLLEQHFTKIDCCELGDCVERMAEATVTVCVDQATNSTLGAWALLEAPEYSAQLHRNEVGRMCLLWEQKLHKSIPDRRLASLISMHVVPFSVQACVAYGLWLAVLRHNEATAGAIGREFAKGVALAAVGQLNAGSVNPRHSALGGDSRRATPR